MPEYGCSTLTFWPRPLEESLALIGSAGFSLVDIVAFSDDAHVDLSDHSDAQTTRLRQIVDGAGVRVASLNCVYDDGPLEERLNRTRVALGLAAAVNAPLITLNLASRQGDLRTAARRWAAEAPLFDALGREAGVEVQWEAPHSDTIAETLLEVTRMLELCQEVRPRLTYDTSHIIAGGSNLAESMRTLGDRVGHVHLRDAIGPDIHYTPGDGRFGFTGLNAYLASLRQPVAQILELEFFDRKTTTEWLVAETRRALEYLSSLPTVD